MTHRIFKDLSIVVPVYNEENNIKPFLARLEKVLVILNVSYEILFCYDRSTDNTEAVIRQAIIRNPRIKLLKFSRRTGQPKAAMAGIMQCRGEACVIIDVDLQDPPELITDMYRKLKNEDYEVILAQRRSRKGETWLKRLFSYTGYKVINALSEIDIPVNTGDFRIISRRIIELRHYKESHGFLRGLVASVGFNQGFVAFDRDERFGDKGKYNRFTGSFKIGLNGLIGFSSKPLQFIAVMGVFLSGFSFLLGGWYVLQKLIGVHITPGLPTTVLLICFFSGVQLLSLGIMGEYVSRIYDEVKNRPPYIIEEFVDEEPLSTMSQTVSQQSQSVEMELP